MEFDLHKWIGNRGEKKVFISYAHKDFGPYVNRLASDLRKNNISIWLDKIDLRPSIEWEEEIERGIEECDKVVFIMSERAVAEKGYCKKEIAYAQQNEKSIIPVKIEDVKPFISICTIQQIEMLDTFKDTIDETSYEEGLNALIDCINDKELTTNTGINKLYKKLKPIPHHMYIDQNAKSYGYDNIRKKLDNWMNKDEGDIALVVADSGSGKSTFIADYADNNELICGINFCKYNNHDRCDTKRILMTLAYELANYIPEYAKVLEKISLDRLEDKDSSAVFDILFLDPLSKISNKPKRIYFAIDGISAITDTNQPDYFPRFIAYQMIPSKLGIKFIITSDNDIQDLYNPIIKVDIFKQEKEDVDEAIKLYLEDTLKDNNINNYLVKKIIDKAEHNFFYAKNVVLDIKKGERNINDIIDNLPIGIKNMYSEFFRRTFNDNDYLSYDDAKQVLMILLAQKQVLSVASIINILGSNSVIKRPEVIVNRTFVLLKNYINVNKLSPQEEKDINNDADGYSLNDTDSSSMAEIIHASLCEWLLEIDDRDPFHIILGEAHDIFINYYEDKIEDGEYTSYICRYYISHLIENGKKENLKKATELLCDMHYAKKRENKLGEHEAFKKYFNDVYDLGKIRNKSGASPENVFKSKVFRDYLVGYRKYLYNQKDAYKRLREIGFTEFVEDYTKNCDSDSDFEFIISMVDYLYIVEEFKKANNLIRKILNLGDDVIGKMPDDIEVEFKKMACLTFRKFGKFELSIEYSGSCEDLNKANDGAFNYDMGVVDLIIGKIHYHKLEFDEAEKTIRDGISLLKSTLEKDSSNNDSSDDFDDFDDFDDYEDNSKINSKYFVDKYISSQNFPRFITNYTAAFLREIALLHLWNNNPNKALEALNEIKVIYDDNQYIIDRYYSRYLFAKMFFQIYNFEASKVIKEFEMIYPFASNDYVKGQMLFFKSIANYVLNNKDNAIDNIKKAIDITEKNREIYEICEMELLSRIINNNEYNLTNDEISSILEMRVSHIEKYKIDDRKILEKWIKYVYDYIVNLKKKYVPKQIYFCDKLEANKFMDILANSRDYSFLDNYNHFKINVNYVLQFGDSSNDIIIYLHGGAYIKEIFPEHIKLCEKIAKETNKMVLAPLYPLAPKYTYQDAYNMVLKLYMKYIDHNIYFIGDSAGGGLALGLAEYLCNEKYKMPKELILISPWLDVSLDNDYSSIEKNDPILSDIGLREMGKRWSGNLDTKNYLVSPLYGNLSNLPNITIYSGTNDILYLDILKFKEIIKDYNTKLELIIEEGMTHIYPILTDSLEAKRTIADIIKRLK